MELLSVVFGLGFLLGWVLAKKDNERTEAPTSVSSSAEQTTEELFRAEGVAPANRSHQQLDSVSVLLYFGAFLMIAGVGLFVGLSDFSGGVKTIAVLLLALVFYSVGLLLHLRVAKLRPVGVTLTAIGLVCLPLTGAAAYFYTDGILSGPMVWFMTSLVSLVLYVGALWYIRQSLMGYLAVCMGVSLWLSIVAIIDAPLYYFSWAGIVLSLIYLVVARRLKVLHEVEQPLSTSASVLVPASLGLMLIFGFGEISLVHMGVSLLLSAAFYLVAAGYESNEQTSETYFGLGYLALPAGVLLIVIDLFHSATITAWTMTGVAVVQLVISHLVLRKARPIWHMTALSATTILLIVGSGCSLPLFNNNWGAYAWLLAFDALAYGFVAAYYKDKSHAAFCAGMLVLLPLIVGFLVMNPHAPAASVSAVLIGLACMFMAMGHKFRVFGALLRVGSIVALLVAWLVGLAGTGWGPTIVSVGVAVVLLLLAYTERLPRLVGAGLVLGCVALVQLLYYQFVQPDWYAIGLLGLVYYFVAKALQQQRSREMYATTWLITGIAGVFLAPVVHFFIHLDAFGGPALFRLWAPGMLSLAGGIVGFEAYLRRSRQGVYAGAAVIMVALQWLLYIGELRELQIYTHLWAVYFGVLSWHAWRSQSTEQRDTFAATALAVLTVPLGFQALGGDTALGRLLLVESIAILLGGLYMRYRLVAWWGLGVAVGSVLYQLRELQFVALVLLGLAIIGLGIYILLRQDKK